MLLSKTCEYAIRAVLYVASAQKAEGRAYVPIRQIADDLDISFHFLTKIFQTLTEAAIVKSWRGPRGGIALARPHREITLMDIIGAVDGTVAFDRCVLGLPTCSADTPCPLHQRWTAERERLKKLFSGTNLTKFEGRLSLKQNTKSKRD